MSSSGFLVTHFYTTCKIQHFMLNIAELSDNSMVNHMNIDSYVSSFSSISI